LSVDNGSLGRKGEKKKKNPVRRRWQFRREKRNPVHRGPETWVSRPGSQDLGFRTSTHRCTDRQTTSLYK
jgi:hypothetical protein